jgi:hypothetical protein
MKERVLANQARKPRYNSKGWVLCRCTRCGRCNYVEPHGTTTKCRCAADPTEHVNLPFTNEI